MILIPQRLFDQSGVQVLLRDGNQCVLSKQLTESTGRREGYLACHALSIVLEGRQIIETYDQETVTVQPGEAILLRRGLYHISDFVAGKNGFRSLLFYFDDLLVLDFLASWTGRPQVSASDQDYAHFALSSPMEGMSKSLPEVFATLIANQPEILRLKLKEMLHLLCQEPLAQQLIPLLHQMSRPRKRGIRAFMERNYHKQLKVEDYAYLTGRSSSSFRRDFKAHFDQTPQQWLKAKRMAAAQQIARSQSISVSQLAFAVGYENVSYFIREFQQFTGQTPKQFMLSPSSAEADAQRPDSSAEGLN